jgi:acyl-[acyl-carrier-protein]-phospholipid O-acyltransferase / long-chain-fatty-acid--[acyl-carrier-protein] ligase
MFALLGTRRFSPLFWCQFFSAFNDNFLKTSLVFLIVFKLTASTASVLVTLAGAVFIAPFFFLSAIGGEMADRNDKAMMARRLKFAEIFASLFACAGFFFHSVPLLFVALFLFGAIGALFGPVKYGILPDHLTKEELPGGNALVEGATFMAILLGTIAGGIAAKDGGDQAQFIGVVMGSALLCWLSARMIPLAGAKAPDITINRNIMASTMAMLRDLGADRRLYLGAIYTSWFWSVGGIAMALLPVLVKQQLGGDESVVTAYLATFAIAIAVGSGLAAKVCHGKAVLLPVVFGGAIMAIASVILGMALMGALPVSPAFGVGGLLASPRALVVGAALALLAIGGGLFIVPAFSAVQAWAGEDRRARVIAGVNILNAGWMVASAIGLAVLQALGLGLPTLFLVLAALNVLAAVFVFRTMPTDPKTDWQAMRGQG